MYLSYNNVSALKTLASQKKWRLSSEKDEVWDLSLFLVYRALPLSFTESIYLVLGSPLQSWAEEHAELQGGYRGGCSRGNSLLSAGRTAQQAELGHLLSVTLTHPPLTLFWKRIPLNQSDYLVCVWIHVVPSSLCPWIRKCELIHRVDDDDFLYHVVTPSVHHSGLGFLSLAKPGEGISQDFILLASKRRPCGSGSVLKRCWYCQLWHFGRVAGFKSAAFVALSPEIHTWLLCALCPWPLTPPLKAVTEGRFSVLGSPFRTPKTTRHW